MRMFINAIDVAWQQGFSIDFGDMSNDVSIDNKKYEWFVYTILH